MKNGVQTKNQHFVPKFYLKNFVDSNNQIQVFDIKNNRINKPKSCSGIGYKEYFYAVKTGVKDNVSQQVEEWLKYFEDVISKDVPKVILKILNCEHINEDDKYLLSVLMAMLWLRSPAMRERMSKMQEDILKQTMGFCTEERVDEYIRSTGKKVGEAQRKKMIDTFKSGKYKLEFSNAHHLRFLTQHFGFGGPGFANMFFGQKWKIYIAKGKQKFITTDSPIVEWWPPPQTIYGPSFLDRKKYFALTPEIFFELTYPVGSSKIKHKTIFSDQDDTVSVFNILLVANAREFAYSQNKETLDRIILGRNNYGSVEKSYYERFQLPWDHAKAEGRTD